MKRKRRFEGVMRARKRTVCPWCRKEIQPGDIIVTPDFRVWLHKKCYREWGGRYFVCQLCGTVTTMPGACSGGPLLCLRCWDKYDGVPHVRDRGESHEG